MKKLTIKEQVNVTNYQEKFLEWLEKNPDKKKNLTEWKDLATIIDNDETNRTNCLSINFSEAIHLSREWQDSKSQFLEYWKSLFWWATFEKHSCGLSGSFHLWNHFVRNYTISTEELNTKIKQLETEVIKLKEELVIEREKNRTSDKKVIEQLTNLYISDEQITAQIEIFPKCSK